MSAVFFFLPRELYRSAARRAEITAHMVMRARSRDAATALEIFARALEKARDRDDDDKYQYPVDRGDRFAPE